MKVSLAPNIKNNSLLFTSAAKNCFSSELIKKTDQANEKLLKRLYKVGHHSIFQHALYTFRIEGVSRYLIWALLHNQPYYNSSQVSQRYVKLNETHIYIPQNLNKEQTKIFLGAIADSFSLYRKITDELKEPISKKYEELKKHKAKTKYFKDKVVKLSIENARYVMPLSYTGHLYYSINLITLLRLKTVAANYGNEAIELIDKMLTKLTNKDKSLIDIVKQIESVTEINKNDNFVEKKETFDKKLNPYKFAKIISKFNEKQTDWLLNFFTTIPENEQINFFDNTNSLLNVDTVYQENKAANIFQYLFVYRNSLSCDAQFQRHRVFERNSLPLQSQITRNISVDDFYIPVLLRNNQQYIDHIVGLIKTYWKLVESGVSKIDALYIIPNAYNVRASAAASLNNLRHFFRMRLCFNAQEEIWKLAADLAKQLSNNKFVNKNEFMPICKKRFDNSLIPICLEHDNFCGRQPWRIEKFYDNSFWEIDM